MIKYIALAFFSILSVTCQENKTKPVVNIISDLKIENKLIENPTDFYQKLSNAAI